MVTGSKNDVLTTSEVAKMLNVAKNTVRKWSDDGTIPAKRIGSRRDRIFSQEDINLFLAKKE